MYRNHLVAVVIPTHNEELHIGGVLEEIPALVDLVIVIDDASTDRTAEVVAGSVRPNLELIRHAENGGLGAAVVAGYRRALQRGADVAVVLDGDGQMDASYLPALLDPVIEGSSDFAKGNRFFSRRSFPGMPRHRVFGNIVLSFLTRLATGYWNMFDSENGFTASSAEILRRLPLNRLEVGYAFPNRLLIELGKIQASVTDVPIPARYGEETSGIRLVRDSLAIVRALFTGFWARMAATYFRGRVAVPGALLVVALLILAAGIGGLLASLLGADAAWIGRVAGPAIVLGLGGLVLFFALDARRSRGDHRTIDVPAPQVVR